MVTPSDDADAGMFLLSVAVRFSSRAPSFTLRAKIGSGVLVDAVRGIKEK